MPLNPRTGQPAASNDPSTWASFEEACRAGYKHIGFMLWDTDPYTIIDLDDKETDPATEEQRARFAVIYQAFESYAELSSSGRGVHIVVRGRIPAGVHRDHVEVYTRARFMICTGNVLRQVPIKDYQELLDRLYGEMKPTPMVELDEEREGYLDDKDLVDMAIRAVNGDKFTQLCNGEWQAMGYPSQSEADFALMSMFAYYSPDNEQCRRLFRMSALGKREKATRNNDYLNRALAKIRAKQPAPVDIDGLKKQAEALIASVVGKSVDSVDNTPCEGLCVTCVSVVDCPNRLNGRDTCSTYRMVVPQKPQEAPQNVPPTNPPPPDRSPPLSSPPAAALPGITLPPGLVGEMALYFYQTAVRPVPEVALSAAIALTAGVVGRSYNVSGTGLNQYLILIAKTGAGKEGAVTGIDNLVAAVRPQIPMVDQFVGPSAFASGQALIKVLDERPCFVSVLGEFGLTLQQLCDSKANSAQIMLRKVLLDLYTKSGWSKVLRSSVYSDVEKNTKVVQAPAVTLLGESTPETFFESLDASHISEGLIPRFMVINYTGKRPRRNPHANCPPSKELAQKFADLVAVALTTSNNGTVCPIQTNPDAQEILDQLDRGADDAINAAHSDVEMQLWNRAHLKALKLSALLAVGVNPHQPIVTIELARWAVDFVRRDVETMATKFRSGDVGHGDSKLGHDLRRVIRAYLQSPYSKVEPYGIEEGMHKDKVVPHVYLQRRTANLAPYRSDRRGASGALRSAIQDAMDGGLIVEVPTQQMRSRYSTSAKAFAIGPAWNKYTAITDN